MIFDERTLHSLDQNREVEIETARPDGSARRTVIWVMVDGGDVFVRSWRGDRGYWYQSATEPGAQVALIVDGRRVPVRVHDATDDASVERASRELARKYADSPSVPGMLRPDVLGTTLRLEPIMTLELRDVAALPDPNIRPPTIAEAGDPFSALRVAHLIARLPRGVPIRLRDVVDRLNTDYLDWSFSRSVVAAVAVQLQSNWIADFRTSLGFELREGDRGAELVMEDSVRVEPWLVRQAERFAAECRTRLRDFARNEGDLP